MQMLFLVVLCCTYVVVTVNGQSCNGQTNPRFGPSTHTAAQCQAACAGACVFSEGRNSWGCWAQKCRPNRCPFNACGDPLNPCAGTCVDGFNTTNGLPEDDSSSGLAAQYITVSENLKSNTQNSDWYNPKATSFKTNSNSKFRTAGNRTYFVLDVEGQLYSEQDNSRIGPYQWYEKGRQYYPATLYGNQQVVVFPLVAKNIKGPPYGRAKMTVYNASVTNQKLYSFTWPTSQSTYLNGPPQLRVYGNKLVMVRYFTSNKTFGVHYIDLMTRVQGRKEFSTNACDTGYDSDMKSYALTSNFKTVGADSFGAIVWVQTRNTGNFDWICVFDIDKNEVSRTKDLDVSGATPYLQIHPDGNGVGKPTVTWRAASKQPIPVASVLVTDVITGNSRWIDHELEGIKWRFNDQCKMLDIQSRKKMFMKDGVLVFAGSSDSILALKNNQISIVSLKSQVPNSLCKSNAAYSYTPQFSDDKMGFLANNTFIITQYSVEAQHWVHYRLDYVNNWMFGNSPSCSNCNNPRAGICIDGECKCNPGCSGSDCSVGDEHCQL